MTIKTNVKFGYTEKNNVHLLDKVNNMDFKVDSDTYDKMYHNGASLNKISKHTWYIQPIKRVCPLNNVNARGSNPKLKKIATEICEKYFRGNFIFMLLRLDPTFDIDINYNSRLSTTGGYFKMTSNGDSLEPSVYWEININPLAKKDPKMLVEIIKHEMCHYYCAKAGFDSNHNSYFFTMFAKFCGCQKSMPKPLKVYKYQCLRCDKVLALTHRLNKRGGVFPYQHICGDGGNGDFKKLE